MIADIAADAERLLGLVENLLLLTRASSEQRVELEPQVLSHVVRRIVSSFRRRHPGREVRLDIERVDLIVEADRGYLDLLLDNLLSNADKYSPPDEPIEVVVADVGDEARVTVLDRGIGVSDVEIDRLFTAFYRSEGARRLTGGLGIGLSAAKHVVTILGGRIWAAARDGGGSEFGFGLPKSSERID
jgi:K+-sensing histidine kinase KdpD